jgi:hypothetical protein
VEDPEELVDADVHAGGLEERLVVRVDLDPALGEEPRDRPVGEDHAPILGTPCRTWNANQDLLAFIAGSSTDDVGFSLVNNTKFQGAVYAVNDYSESNSADMWGPVIARQLFISNNTHNHYVPFGTLLPGMPATYEEVTVLAPVQGGFGD